MADSHRYAMLLSALPHHGPLFGARQTPLSRQRLAQRLTLLEPDDAACLHTLNLLLDWSWQRPERSDAAVMAGASQLLDTLHHPFVRDLAVWRLELRTLVAALRRRRRGDPAPADPRWGFGRWLGTIQRHWHEPAFRLDGPVPWLPEAGRLLERGDALELERLLFGVSWTHLERLGDGHHFDFEAVVLYVQRWNLVARWTSYDGATAARRFEALTTDALAALDLDLD